MFLCYFGNDKLRNAHDKKVFTYISWSSGDGGAILKNRRQKYHTVGTVKKYHTVRTVQKYHTVRTVQKYHTVRTVQKYHTVGTVQKYHTVRTVQKSNSKIVERGKIDTLRHIYITTHFHGLARHLNKTWGGWSS